MMGYSEIGRPAEDAMVRTWRRIAYKLKGEGLSFQAAATSDRFEALLVGTTDDGFLIFDPERLDDGTSLEPFHRVRSVTPLSEARANELRAAFERSGAAA
jgi:hypothetical protein